MEAAGGEPLDIQQYRKNVYEKFPTSLFAAEAYLRCYPFKDYLQGHSEALDICNLLKKIIRKALILSMLIILLRWMLAGKI